MGVRVAVFASGGGTTFQALVDHVRGGEATTWTVELVVSDRAEAGVLRRATEEGIPTAVLSDRGREPADVAAATLELLANHRISVVCLAGYLRLVPEPVVRAFEGRMLNVHPALLPSFGGKGMYGDRVHRAVLEAGTRVSGPTVHLVDAEYDRGMPVAQWPVPVLSQDTMEALRARVQAAERALYPFVVDHLAQAVVEGGPPSPLSLRRAAFAAAEPIGPRTHSSEVGSADIREIIRHAFNEDDEPRSA